MRESRADPIRKVFPNPVTFGKGCRIIRRAKFIKEIRYSKLLNKFGDHFEVQKNIIFERARFNKRNQLDSETADEYINVLYGLIETCDHSTLKDDMLRDRLVVGIRDTAVSEKLQLNAKLTLEGAIKEIRKREAVWEQSQQLQVVDRSSHSSHSRMGEVRGQLRMYT